MVKIGIIGGGNMGAAIIGGIDRHYRVSVCEQDRKRRGQLKRKYKVSVADLAQLVRQSKVIILAVKPQRFDDLLKQLRPLMSGNHLIVSIAAGITTTYIETRLGKGVRVVRTMPNLPAQIGMGITGISAGKKATSGDIALVRRLFHFVGSTVEVQEKYLDAITAASGSGPAYVFLFIETFTKAVRALGFDEGTARQLVAQTIWGSLGLLATQGEDAAVMRARVTSKGGTTQAAMEVFRKRQFEKTFKAALRAAKKRARELSKR